MLGDVEISLDVEKAVMNGIIALIRRKVFYGHILQQLGKIFMSGPTAPIPTMAVGKRPEESLIKLFVNKDFVKFVFKDALTSTLQGDALKQKKDEIWQKFLAIFEHEVLHIVFEHLTLKFSDHQRGAVAMDCAVNSFINKSYLIEGAVHPSHYSLEEKKTAFWYYTHLQDNKQYQSDCKNGGYAHGGKFGNAVEAHKLWEDMSKDPVLSDLVKDIVRKAKESCERTKDYGEIPAEIIQSLEGMLENKKPIVPWQRVLRLFCASATESNLDYTMKKVSKRFGTRPGTKKEDVLNLAVAMDTSGCFVDGTLISMADGGLKRIEDVQIGDMLLSSSFGEGLTSRKCTNVFKYNAEELVTVKTSRGYEFTCTPQHKIFVVKANELIKKARVYEVARRDRFYDEIRNEPVVEIEAKDLKKGDLLVVSGAMGNGSDSVFLPKLSTEESGMYITQEDIDRADTFKKSGVSYRKQCRDGMMKYHYSSLLHAKKRGLAKNLVTIPIRTSVDFCQFMGYAIGDGNPSTATFALTDENRKRLEYYSTLIKEVFNLDSEVKNWQRQRLITNSRSLALWLKKNFPTAVCRSLKREIPEILTRVSLPELCGLLRGLFDAEGFVGEHYVALTNSSKQLITQIHLLLSQFGIESCICKADNKDRMLGRKMVKSSRYWRISIFSKDNIEKFYELIGFSCEEKTGKLDKVFSKMENNQNKSSFQYTKDQNLVFVESVITKSVPSTVVRDLEVEDHHNYFANGVLVHNSISNEQLVMFLNEIRWIWKNGAKVTVFENDCADKPLAVYEFKGKFTGKIHGRGGTDLEPVLKAVTQGRRYDALIYFTDFYAPKIETQYNIPILWVLTTELPRDQFPYPWGKFIKIEGEIAVPA